MPSSDITPTLPLKLIDTLAADDLASEAFGALVAAPDRPPGGVHPAWPRHWRAVYTTFYLEVEVENGGLHQFFWNSEGALNQFVADDLRFIGADEHAAVFAEALDIFAKHDYHADRSAAGMDWHKFTMAYREKRFEVLDQTFYAVKPSVIVRIGNYIKAHPTLFGG